MADSKASGGGISVLSLLGVLFIGLKLTHVIDWPWLWVLAPFWIGIAVFLAIIAIISVVGIICVVIGAWLA